MTRLVCVLLALSVAPVSVHAQFTYTPPGELESPGGGATRPGAGRVDDRVYAPGMRFPIESGPAYANSQIYGHGGYMGPGGGQCTAANFAYPWHDNYCEERSWDMPLCPSGRGHQGQDIRPATCVDNTHWAVAAADGTITNIGSYSVYVTADDGTRYDYLHMEPSSLVVSRGQRVTRGQRLGRVSDAFGGTSTTIHLHFNIRQNVSGVGTVYVPTYMSLVESYAALIGVAVGPDYRAEFVNQTFPLASMPFELTPGETSTGYIEMRNTGEATWNPGEIFLGTTSPRDVASPIAGPGWIGASRPATVNRVVAPGETGRFEFTVQAPVTEGDYAQYFNLVHEGVAWFSDDGGPPDEQLQVRVQVVCPETGCDPVGPVDADGDGHNTSVDCDDSDPTIHPGASDPCGDGVDQNCDGNDVCGVDAGPRPDAGSFDGGPMYDGGGSDAATPVIGPRKLVGGCSAGGGGAAWWLLLFTRRRRQTAARQTAAASSAKPMPTPKIPPGVRVHFRSTAGKTVTLNVQR